MRSGGWQHAVTFELPMLRPGGSEVSKAVQPSENTEAATDVSARPGGPGDLGHGDVLTAVSDGMVALLKEFYGRGPTRAKSYYQDDLVVCVLRGGFSRVEQTLLDGGRGAAVIQQRMEFQELMRERFTQVVEAATGRPVVGFMSGNQQHPDLMCEVFVLGPSDVVDAGSADDRDGTGASGGSSLPPIA